MLHIFSSESEIDGAKDGAALKKYAHTVLRAFLTYPQTSESRGLTFCAQRASAQIICCILKIQDLGLFPLPHPTITPAPPVYHNRRKVPTLLESRLDVSLEEFVRRLAFMSWPLTLQWCFGGVAFERSRSRGRVRQVELLAKGKKYHSLLFLKINYSLHTVVD